MHIQIRDLAREVTEEDLRKAFESYGEVTSVTISREKIKGKLRVEAEVEMPDQDAALAAIEHLKGRNLKGRPLQIAYHRTRLTGGRPGGSRRSAGDKVGGTHGGARF